MTAPAPEVGKIYGHGMHTEIAGATLLTHDNGDGAFRGIRYPTNAIIERGIIALPPVVAARAA
jgi:hypothetical protein